MNMPISNHDPLSAQTKATSLGTESGQIIRYEGGAGLHEPKPRRETPGEHGLNTKLRFDGPSSMRSSLPRYPFAFFFGILLPILTTLIELTTRMSTSIYLDPLPNFWHTLLVLSVPAVNFWIWRALRRGPSQSERIKGLGMASGFSLGVLTYYSLLYAVLSPFAFMAILIYGLGLLPLTPLFGLIATLRLRYRFKEQFDAIDAPLRGSGWGFIASIAALLLVALPIYLTRHWSQSYVSGTAQEKSDALRWLRRIGSEQTLLKDCYVFSGRDSGIFELYPQGKPVTAAQAQELYYRVTGERFNSKAPPQLGLSASRWNFMDDLSWDPDAGGTQVGGRLKGLSLAESQVSGIVNSDAAWSYQEWTLEFENTALVDREARAQIQLPHGGVVSRLTLWVNGEEREAAFASSELVRLAYQKVVTVQRRDPVLVTQSGPDRVLMQCFPVPSRGGRIKVRLGITAPLSLTSQETATLTWPHFIERNFAIGNSLSHHLHLQSNVPITSPNSRLRTELIEPGKHLARGVLTDLEMGSTGQPLILGRSEKSLHAWSKDAKGSPGYFVSQELAATPGTLPRRAIVVLDGSKRMKPFRNEILEALRQLPEGLEMSVWLAGESPTLLVPFTKNSQQLPELIAQRVNQVSWLGGQDNLPALKQAWASAKGMEDSVLLWIHCPQPEEVSRDETSSLPLPWSQHAPGPGILEFQVAAGSDALVSRFYKTVRIESVERRGTVQADLTALFGRWHPNQLHWVAVRKRLSDSSLPENERGAEGSDHLTRLWAKDEVLRLIESGKTQDAVRVARQYQLVTPVSGAVVLETRQQYEEAGLEPVNSDSVPVVPEPATLALVALGLALVCLLKRRTAASVNLTRSPAALPH